MIPMGRVGCLSLVAGSLPFSQEQGVKTNMKKFAVIIASLTLFAGCTQNDPGDFGATETETDTTATGAAGTSQSDYGTSGTLSSDTNSLSDTNMLSDTNNFSDTNSLQSPGQGSPGSSISGSSSQQQLGTDTNNPTPPSSLQSQPGQSQQNNNSPQGNQ